MTNQTVHIDGLVSTPTPPPTPEPLSQPFTFSRETSTLMKAAHITIKNDMANTCESSGAFMIVLIILGILIATLVFSIKTYNIVRHL